MLILVPILVGPPGLLLVDPRPCYYSLRADINSLLCGQDRVKKSDAESFKNTIKQVIRDKVDKGPDGVTWVTLKEDCM